MNFNRGVAVRAVTATLCVLLCVYLVVYTWTTSSTLSTERVSQANERRYVHLKNKISTQGHENDRQKTNSRLPLQITPTQPHKNVMSNKNNGRQIENAMNSKLSQRNTTTKKQISFQQTTKVTTTSEVPVSCQLMWEGNETELAKGEINSRNKPESVRNKTLQEYHSATRNCSLYRQNGGFEMASVNQEELSFPLAFSLVVYRDADQVERFVSAIYRPHNVYCIHIDKKSPKDYWDKLQLVVGCLPNVFVSSVSVDVKWGKFTNLEPEILCMRDLWQHEVQWRYFINLTGQEFALKTNKELVRILKAFQGANDIMGDSQSFQSRWAKWLPAPYNLTIYKGSVHIVASRGYVDYVLHSKVGQALLEWVKPTDFPDESFFNTLNHNPQLGVPGSVATHQIYQRSGSLARYKMWTEEKVHPCSGKFVRMICHFGVRDLPRLVRSPKLFANKFTYDYQPLAQDCLMEWYRYKVRLEEEGRPLPLEMAVYQQAKFVKNRNTGPIKIW